MQNPKFSLRRTVVATVVVVGGGALLAASFFVRRDPSAPARRAHAERGVSLGMVRAKPSDPAAPAVRLPPMRRVGQGLSYVWSEPLHDPWVTREIGIATTWSDADVRYTFRDDAVERTAFMAAKGRCVYAALSSRDWWGAVRPPEGYSTDPAAMECHRDSIDSLMGELARTTLAPGDEPLSEELAHALPPLVAWLALRGEREQARQVLDRFLVSYLDSWRFYADDFSPQFRGMPEEVAPLINLPARNRLAEGALLLDAAGVDTTYLDRMAEALEREVPSREKLQWMAEEQLFARVEQAHGVHSGPILQTNMNPLYNVAGGIPEWLVLSVQRPTLRAQCNDFFAAWMRRDYPEAIRARQTYAATAARMNLRDNGIEYAFGYAGHASAAAWCRECADVPARLERVETARFVVASLRFRRAEGRWPAGLEELVPRWLEPGSVGSDGSRWGVHDQAAFEGPAVVDPRQPDRLHGLRNYADQTGEAPPTLAMVGLGDDAALTYAARPVFWRIGPANPCSLYFCRRMSALASEVPLGPEDKERLAFLQEIFSPESPWREVHCYMAVVVPSEAVLRLLGPQEVAAR